MVVIRRRGGVFGATRGARTPDYTITPPPSLSTPLLIVLSATCTVAANATAAPAPSLSFLLLCVHTTLCVPHMLRGMHIPRQQPSIMPSGVLVLVVLVCVDGAQRGGDRQGVGGGGGGVFPAGEPMRGLLGVRV
jgi:hypothetical protein